MKLGIIDLSNPTELCRKNTIKNHLHRTERAKVSLTFDYVMSDFGDSNWSHIRIADI